MDMADSVELFCYWLKDNMSWSKSGKKDVGMSVSEYRTGNVRVHHANDDDEEDGDHII